jgi:hypothetical protein
MKVLLIGTGIGTWPNDGWGACENLVADFAWALEQVGAEVRVVHEKHPEYTIENHIQEFKPDIVHCEYDDHMIALLPVLQKYPQVKTLLTTHYAMLSQPYKLVQDGYMDRFLFACDLAIKSPLTLAVLSKEIANSYVDLGKVPLDKLWIFPNGTRVDKIKCSAAPLYSDRALCLGKIEVRKNQASLQTCPQIDFVGPITDDRFKETETYKGLWTRTQVYENLTQYPCLILISKGEGHPLVIGEALAAGCAIICNEISAANLPRNVPWVRVVPDSIVESPELLTKTVLEMCKIGCEYRNDIRLWAIRNLDWRMRACSYLDHLLPGKRIMKTAVIDTKGLRIALIGPGIMPIPPTGWGAVEQIIWDQAVLLRKLGHHVQIINTKNTEEIIETVNDGKYDIAHLHYDVYWNVIPRLTVKVRCITSHYPYIDKPQMWERDSYGPIFKGMVDLTKLPNVFLYPASQKDRMVYLQSGNVDPARIKLYKNGIPIDRFEVSENPHFPNRSVCLAKIEKRKRQHLTYWHPNIDYIGRGEFHHPNFRGEVGHDILYKLLTNYGNLVMLSEGENGTPLVVKEGMAAGLGCVLSKSAANELPGDLPWVTVLSEEELADPQQVESAIEHNRKVCRTMRAEIRKWVQENWDMETFLKEYVLDLSKVMGIFLRQKDL